MLPWYCVCFALDTCSIIHFSFLKKNSRFWRQSKLLRVNKSFYRCCALPYTHLLLLRDSIVDKNLKNLRNARWEKAFHNEGVSIEGAQNEKSARDRKATIVIEHLIQASDIAHTMQHWHIFRKWNERLFQEMYKAYREGRAEKDPAEFWYKGEIGFFDFYIIPLAKKLKECGVFGVSSSEYLDYALKNRAEWELKGEQVVEEMKLNLICMEEEKTDAVA